MAINLREALALERNILVISLTAGIVVLSWLLWFPFLPIYLARELGADPVQIGFVTSIAFVAYIFCVPFGYIADACGRKPLIVAGTFLIGAMAALLSFAPTLDSFAITFAALNIAHAMYIGALFAVVGDTAGPERAVTAYAVWVAIISILASPGPAIGGYLAELWGTFRPLFIISGAATVAMAAVRFVLLDETIRDRITLRDSLVKLKRELPRNLRDVVLRGKRWRFFAFVCMSVLAFAVVGFAYGPQAFVVLYAEEVIGLRDVEIGLWATLSAIPAATIAVPIAKCAERRDEKKALGFCLLSCLLFLGFLNSRNLADVLAFTIPIAVAMSLFYALIKGMLAGFVEIEQRATAMSILTALTHSAGIVGPLVGGFLYALEPRLPFYATICLCMLVLAFVAPLVPSKHQLRAR